LPTCLPDTGSIRRHTRWLEASSEGYVLDHRGHEWVVYYSERGLESGLRSFESEDLACRHLADLVWKDRTVRRSGE
jgi:hypothetical protein